MIYWNEKHKKVASIAADHRKLQLVCCGGLVIVVFLKVAEAITSKLSCRGSSREFATVSNDIVVFDANNIEHRAIVCLHNHNHFNS